MLPVEATNCPGVVSATPIKDLSKAVHVLFPQIGQGAASGRMCLSRCLFRAGKNFGSISVDGTPGPVTAVLEQLWPVMPAPFLGKIAAAQEVGAPRAFLGKAHPATSALAPGDEHARTRRRARSYPATSTLVPGDEHARTWRRARSHPATSTLAPGDEHARTWRRVLSHLVTSVLAPGAERARTWRQASSHLAPGALAPGAERARTRRRGGV